MINEVERKRILSLKRVQRQKLMAEVKKMDNLLNKIQSQNISYTNKLIYAAAIVVTERLGVKLDRQKSWKEPMWKRRMDGQIKQLRKDLARV